MHPALAAMKKTDETSKAPAGSAEKGRRKSLTVVCSKFVRQRFLLGMITDDLLQRATERAVDGTVDSISSMSRDTLRGFVEANYRPEGGGLVVVGDVEPDEVEQLLDDSPAVIIGAMLVAPLMTPLIGLGLAIVQGHRGSLGMSAAPKRGQKCGDIQH